MKDHTLKLASVGLAFGSLLLATPDLAAQTRVAFDVNNGSGSQADLTDWNDFGGNRGIWRHLAKSTEPNSGITVQGGGTRMATDYTRDNIPDDPSELEKFVRDIYFHDEGFGDSTLIISGLTPGVETNLWIYSYTTQNSSATTGFRFDLDNDDTFDDFGTSAAAGSDVIEVYSTQADVPNVLAPDLGATDGFALGESTVTGKVTKGILQINFTPATDTITMDMNKVSGNGYLSGFLLEQNP